MLKKVKQEKSVKSMIAKNQMWMLAIPIEYKPFLEGLLHDHMLLLTVSQPEEQFKPI